MSVRVNRPGDVLLYDGELAEVIGIGEGRSITLQFIRKETCPTCGSEPRLHLLEHSPLFQDHAEPVGTITS